MYIYILVLFHQSGLLALPLLARPPGPWSLPHLQHLFHPTYSQQLHTPILSGSTSHPITQYNTYIYMYIYHISNGSYVALQTRITPTCCQS